MLKLQLCKNQIYYYTKLALMKMPIKKIAIISAICFKIGPNRTPYSKTRWPRRTWM